VICSNCHADIGEDPLFCPECGHEPEENDDDAVDGAPERAAPPPPQGGPPPRTAMQVCTQCGIIAPTKHTRCTACGATLSPGAQPTAPDRPDGRYWVQVRVTFQCRQCEHMSPLNHVDVDGTFTCQRCQFEQAADASIWRSGLRFCHDVGDLAGPSPEGRAPDPVIRIHDEYADIGISRASAEIHINDVVSDQNGRHTRNLHVEASPGVPLCERCRRPLEVEVTGAGELATRCGGCGEAARYSAQKATFVYARLVGAISSEHRADRADARLHQPTAGGAVAIECPKCNAPLTIGKDDQFVTCRFCGTASKVPARMRSKLFRETIEPERWWLLFEGPSQKREALVGQVKQRREKQARRQIEQAERQASDKANRAQKAAEAQARKAREDAAAAAAQRKAVLPLVLTMIFGGAGGLVAYFTHAPKPKPPPKTAAAAVAPKPPPRPTAKAEPPPREAYELLKDCGCKARPAKSTKPEPVALAMRFELASKMSMGGVTHIVAKAGYFLDVGERHFPIQPGSGDAPPPAVEGVYLPIAIGCDKDVVGIVGPGAATGWSASTGEKLWTSMLSNAPPPRTGDGGVHVDCHKSVTQAGILTVLPAPGEAIRPVRVRLSDGKVL
jgi:hypothetical protein